MVKKFTQAIIEQYLNNYDKKYYLRELSSLLKKPHQTIKPYVESLVKDGILIKNKRKKIVEYNLNFKDNRVYDYLIISEKEKLIDRLREDALLRVLFEKLSPLFNKATIVIFGSTAVRTSKDSDIDLLVIGKQNMSKIIEDFESVYNKKIHKIQIGDVKNLTLTFIKEVYKKHLIFNNTELVVRLFGELYEQNKLV